jgi:hypothetical protein
MRIGNMIITGISSLFGALFLTLVLFSGYAQAEENMPPFRKSQFFCGYCHILTYPKVIKKAHSSWKRGKHKDVPCAQCHYPPEKYGIEIREHRKIPRDEWAAEKKKTEMELMKTELEIASRLWTILNMEDSTVLRRTKVDDRSCTTSKCHPKAAKGKRGEYWAKKIKFSQYERSDKSKGIVYFKHDGHFKKDKWIKGDVMHCATCHQRETEKKHFEVSKAGCFICHFGNGKFNEGLSKCALCHKVPTKPLQKQKSAVERKKDEKPITHKSLEEAKVACWSCHIEVLNGNGKISKEKCRNCHDNGNPLMEKAEKQELMHREHVAEKNARCFECHEPIEHKRDVEYYNAATEDCSVCHRDPHILQKKLLAGNAVKGVEKVPALMHDVKTNCLGCHIKFEHNKVGGEVKRAKAKACVDCHTERHEAMLKEWKDKIKEELDAIKEVQEEAEAALKKAKGKVPDKKLQQALEKFKKAEDTLNIVRYGNGVHNKKYSITLIDVAFGHYEDVIDALEGGDE